MTEEIAEHARREFHRKINEAIRYYSNEAFETAQAGLGLAIDGEIAAWRSEPHLDLTANEAAHVEHLTRRILQRFRADAKRAVEDFRKTHG